jgi:hypothetical protein
MGKTAQNEKIKLRAAFLNNCAVGLIIGGVLLPLLAVYARLPFLPAAEDLPVIVLGLIACLVALWAAWRHHNAANQELDKLED